MKFDKEEGARKRDRDQRIDLIDPDRGITINNRLPDKQILLSL